MTVNTELDRATLAWTGVETAFAPGFPADQPGHVKVTFIAPDETETPLVLDTHFSVTLAAETRIVTVLPIALPAAPGTLFIQRRTPALQQTAFRDNGRFSQKTHELLADLEAMRSGELRFDVDWALGWLKTIRAEVEGAVDDAREEAEAAEDARLAAEGILDTFDDAYLGRKNTFPTLDNDGDPLAVGALVSIYGQPDPLNNGLYEWHDGAWYKLSIAPVAVRRVGRIVATAGQTVVPITLGYMPGMVDVWKDGVRQHVGIEITAGDGATVVFAAPLSAGEVVEWVVYAPFNSAFVLAATNAEDIAGTATDRFSTPASNKAALDSRIGEGFINIVKDADPAIDNEVELRSIAVLGRDVVLGGLPEGLLIRDLAGQTLFRVDRNGKATVGSLAVYPPPSGVLDGSPFAFFVRDKRGTSLFGVDRAGRATAAELKLVGQARPAPVLDGPRNAPLIKDKRGRMLLGWRNDPVDPERGGLAGEPSQDFADRVRDKASYRPPALLRDGREIDDAAESGQLLTGTLSDRDGFRLKVGERRAGAVPTALVMARGPAELFLGVGQSNRGVGGTALNPRKLVGPLYRSSVVGFAQGTTFIAWSNGSAPLPDPDGLTDFLPYQDWASNPELPQSQHAMSSFGVEMARRAAGTPGPGLITHLVWQGGAVIESFVEGSPLFEQKIAIAARAKALAQLYERDLICRAVSFTQGESGATGVYQTELDGFVTSARTRLQAALAQDFAPAVLITQTNIGDVAATGNSIAQAQLNVHLARPTEALITGPMYQTRMTDGGIHGDAESRMMIGEVEGEVYYRLAAGLPWYVLRMHSAVRTGSLLRCKYTASDASYRLPGDDIEFDPGEGEPGDGWVKPIFQLGFDYRYNGVSVPIVASAAAADPNGRYTIIDHFLSSDPGAAATEVIRYALADAGDTVEDGWSSGRGQVRSRGRRSTYRALGHAVPEHIWFYALKQELAVS